MAKAASQVAELHVWALDLENDAIALGWASLIRARGGRE
jgi:hypothetical protein